MNLGWKIISTVAGLAAGVAANKVLDLGWKAVLGHEPPDTDDFESDDFVEIVVFAAVSGAVIGLTRQLALRQAAKMYGNPIEKAKAN